MNEWRTYKSCVFKNHAHLVFTKKYRRKVFTLEMSKRVEDIMRETCLQMDCELLEYGAEDNHIHMMVAVHPKIAVSNLVGKLKGKSSYMIRKEFWAHEKTMLWGNHFWSPSYCVVSSGGASLDVVKSYIESQNTPPSERSLRASRAANKRN